jgi:hypothetical protein
MGMEIEQESKERKEIAQEASILYLQDQLMSLLKSDIQFDRNFKEISKIKNDLEKRICVETTDGIMRIIPKTDAARCFFLQNVEQLETAIDKKNISYLNAINTHNDEEIKAIQDYLLLKIRKDNLIQSIRPHENKITNIFLASTKLPTNGSFLKRFFKNAINYYKQFKNKDEKNSDEYDFTKAQGKQQFLTFKENLVADYYVQKKEKISNQYEKLISTLKRYNDAPITSSYDPSVTLPDTLNSQEKELPIYEQEALGIRNKKKKKKKHSNNLAIIKVLQGGKEEIVSLSSINAPVISRLLQQISCKDTAEENDLFAKIEDLRLGNKIIVYKTTPNESLQLPENLHYNKRVTDLYTNENPDQLLEQHYYKETMGTKTKNKIKLMKLFSPLADKYLPYGILAKTTDDKDAIILAGRIHQNKSQPIDCLFTWGYNNKTGEIYHRAATTNENAYPDYIWKILKAKKYDYDFPEL